MKTYFVVSTDAHSNPDLKKKFFDVPDIIYGKGDAIGGTSKRHAFNVLKFQISNSHHMNEIQNSMMEFLNRNEDSFLSIDAYKYFDFVIEIGSLDGDFVLSKNTIERLRAADIQIEVDITRY